MNPIISIVIPVYNEEKSVKKTVQQFSELQIPHEVIVSDTHSTDQTVAIAKNYAHEVLILAPHKKRGVSHGRNDGAAVAHGKFVVFIDCDTTVPDPNSFFKKALACFERDPKLVGVSARIEIDKETRTFSDAAVSNLMNAWFAFLNNIAGIGMAAGKFQMMKIDAFRKTGGFNGNLTTAEDIDLFARLRKFGRTRIIWGLAVFHSGRRFHQKGAWHTLFLWMKNAISFWLFKKPSDTWEPLR